MSTPDRYTDRDIEVAERLTRVESTLLQVSATLTDHQTTSERRASELAALITSLGQKIEESKFSWGKLVSNPNVVRALIYLVSTGALTGIAKVVYSALYS